MRDFECESNVDAVPMETDGYAFGDLFACSDVDEESAFEPKPVEEMNEEEFAANRSEMLRQARAMVPQVRQPSNMEAAEKLVYCRKRHRVKTTCPCHAPPSNTTQQERDTDTASDLTQASRKKSNSAVVVNGWGRLRK